MDVAEELQLYTSAAFGASERTGGQCPFMMSQYYKGEGTDWYLEVVDIPHFLDSLFIDTSICLLCTYLHAINIPDVQVRARNCCNSQCVYVK